MLEYEIPSGREFHDILHDSSPAVGSECHQCYLSGGGRLIGLVFEYVSHNLSNKVFLLSDLVLANITIKAIGWLAFEYCNAINQHHLTLKRSTNQRIHQLLAHKSAVAARAVLNPDGSPAATSYVLSLIERSIAGLRVSSDHLTRKVNDLAYQIYVHREQHDLLPSEAHNTSLICRFSSPQNNSLRDFRLRETRIQLHISSSIPIECRSIKIFVSLTMIFIS